MIPKNFGPNIKSIKFLESGGVKTRVGRVFENNIIFVGLILCSVYDFNNNYYYNVYWPGHSQMLTD